LKSIKSRNPNFSSLSRGLCTVHHLPLQLQTEVVRYAREGKTRCDVATPLSRTRKSRRGNVALRETRRVVSHRAQRDTKQATSVVLRPETQCRSFARYRNRVDGLRNLAVSSPCAQVLGHSSPLESELTQADGKHVLPEKGTMKLLFARFSFTRIRRSHPVVFLAWEI